MGNHRRYKDLSPHIRSIRGVRDEQSPSPHDSPLHTEKPSSSVRPAAGVPDSLRANAGCSNGSPEGGLGSRRMKTRLLSTLLAAAALIVAALTALTIPATAQTISVRLPSGEIVEVDVPPGTSIDDIQLPGTPVTPTTPAPAPPEAPAPAPKPEPGAPSAGGGSQQNQSSSGERVRREREKQRELTGGTKGPAEDETSKKDRKRNRDGSSELRNSDGTPTAGNPGFVDALPGPSTAAGVPNFVIRKFRVPPFLLPIYQAAGIEYGIRWEVLAAINEIETDYGRNLNVSSRRRARLDAVHPVVLADVRHRRQQGRREGPLQPRRRDLRRARYLKAAGDENDVRRAIFAYNHADWYVDSRAAARASDRRRARRPRRLADRAHRGPLPRLRPRPLRRRPRRARAAQARQEPAQNAAQRRRVRATTRRSIDIFARTGAPVVAVNDGVDQEDRRAARSSAATSCSRTSTATATPTRSLGAISKHYPVPEARRRRPGDFGDGAQGQRRSEHEALPKPRRPPGRPPERRLRQEAPPRAARRAEQRTPAAAPSVPVKERLFAHPDMHRLARGRRPRAAPGRQGAQGRLLEIFKNYFSRALRPRARRRSSCAASRWARA